jgi:hypothetical protein
LGYDTTNGKVIYGGTNALTFTNAVTFSNITASGTLTATGNATLNGVGNTAPSQTASSGSSLMTRDLSDGRYFGFSQLFYEKQDFSTAGTGATNGGGISASRGNVRYTAQSNNLSGAMWIASVKRGLYTTTGNSTATEGYGVYALAPNAVSGTDTVFGIFYGSALANGVSSFEPLSTNGYSVQLRNNGTNQLRYVYKNGTNEVSGPWTDLPSAASALVEIAAINTTNGFRVLYRRPGGLGTPDWTTLTNVAVAWTNPVYVGPSFGGAGFVRTNTNATFTLYDLNEWGFIIGGENL